jgi:hypothetical protein
MPQVDITLLFIIIQTFSILFFVGYFIFLLLFPQLVTITKIKNKINLFTLLLTKLTKIRIKHLSLFNSIKFLKILDN